MFANFTNFAHPTDRSLVARVVLGSIKCTLFKRSSAIDRSVAGSTDLKFCKLVEFDFNGVIWIAFTLSLCFLGLYIEVSMYSEMVKGNSMIAYVFDNFARTSIRDNAVGKAQSRVVIFALNRHLDSAQ